MIILGYNDSDYWGKVQAYKKVRKLEAENKTLRDENQKLKAEIEELKKRISELEHKT